MDFIIWLVYFGGVMASDGIGFWPAICLQLEIT